MPDFGALRPLLPTTNQQWFIIPNKKPGDFDPKLNRHTGLPHENKRQK